MTHYMRVTHIFECDRCGHEDELQDHTATDGECVNQEYSDDSYTSPDGESYCSSCYNDHVCYCQGCDTEVWSEDATYIESIGEYRCESCAEEYLAEEDEMIVPVDSGMVIPGLCAKITCSKSKFKDTLVSSTSLTTDKSVYELDFYELDFDTKKWLMYNYYGEGQGIRSIEVWPMTGVINIVAYRNTNNRDTTVSPPENIWKLIYGRVLQNYYPPLEGSELQAKYQWVIDYISNTGTSDTCLPIERFPKAIRDLAPEGFKYVRPSSCIVSGLCVYFSESWSEIGADYRFVYVDELKYAIVSEIYKEYMDANR